MAPPKRRSETPTQAEAWQAILPYEAELDDLQKPGGVRNGILDILSQTWNKAGIDVPIGEFAQLWKDRHYRAIVTKMVATGPGAETFDAVTYRRMKTSRLEGFWDVLLEGFADWIESFAKDYKSLVSLEDSQRLVACLDDEHEDSQVYEVKLNELFWQEAEQEKPLSRSPGFLTQLPLPAYVNAYETLLVHHPKSDWDVENLINEIHLRSEDCKPLMLHVCFWFNPNLVEPANRAENKEPMFYHLKPAFSRYRPEQSSYDKDESWKPEAIALQRAVIDFILEHWETSRFEAARYCKDPHLSNPSNPYSDRFQNSSWYELVLLVRNNTNVPFKHPDLLRFNNRGKSQPPPTGRTAKGRAVINAKLKEQVNNIIAAKFGPRSSPSTSPEDYDSALEEISPPADYTKRPPKRKASVLEQKPEEDDFEMSFSVPSSPTQRQSQILKLKMPPQWVTTNGSDMKKASDPANHNVNSLNQKADIPTNIPIGHPVGHQAVGPAKPHSVSSTEQPVNPSVNRSPENPASQTAVPPKDSFTTSVSQPINPPGNPSTNSPGVNGFVPSNDSSTASANHPNANTTIHTTFNPGPQPGPQPGFQQAYPPTTTPGSYPSSTAPTNRPTFAAVNNFNGPATQPAPNTVNGINRSSARVPYRTPYAEDGTPSPLVQSLRLPTPPKQGGVRPTGFWPSEAIPRPGPAESTPPAAAYRANEVPSRPVESNTWPAANGARPVAEVQDPSPTMSAPSRTPSMKENSAPTSSVPELRRIAIAADNVANREQASNNGSPQPQPQISSRPVRRHAHPPERSYRILPPPSDNVHVPRSSSERRRTSGRHRPSSQDKRSKTELAIMLLEQQYSSKLSINEMVVAIDVVTRDNNASIFVTLTGESLRDAWLFRAIQKSAA